MNVYKESVLLTNEIFRQLDDKYTISSEKFCPDYVTECGALITDQISCTIKEGEGDIYIEKLNEFIEIRKKLIMFINTNFPEASNEYLKPFGDSNVMLK